MNILIFPFCSLKTNFKTLISLKKQIMNLLTPYFKWLIRLFCLSNIEKNANHFRDVLNPLKELTETNFTAT